ncbi:fused MFS/spermidine synthase [Xanthobacter sp. KR7-65]|uniref:fused MFS/spermidine synthase n=1 Tax=Xanthobacter sp. KR7-65 TaxID=3156612 RepID=UPI0032B4338D
MSDARVASPAPPPAAPLAAARIRLVAVSTVAFTSGFAGLGYEIVWARMLAVALGHEIVAVLGVVSALFAGLALGSLLLGRRIARSGRPAFWYAGLEVVIGVWALALIVLSPLATRLVPAVLPLDASAVAQWLVAFSLPLFLLLPATLAMGATLPALEAMLAPLLASGGAVGPVYAANTLGAVAGTLATAFLLIPAVGLSTTLAVCAFLNFGCAALLLVRPAARRAIASPDRSAQGRAPLAGLFITGLLGIGYEVLTVRVLSQILENTIYTFALLLAAYLAGTALGAGLHHRFAGRADPRRLTSTLVAATALACLAGAALLGVSDVLLDTLRNLLPATVEGRLGAELAIAALTFLPPTIAMGALFTQLAQAASDRAGGVGDALAANTLGAALAPILFGPVLLPLLGAKAAFAVIALGYLLALPDLRRPATLAAGSVAAATLALVLAPVSLRFVPIPPGGALLWHRDGVMAAVSVVRNGVGDQHLQVNNHFRMGGSASMRSDHRQAHIPLLLHPDPKRALFLGLGTGATLSAAADHPGLAADGVELVPEVVETFPFFAQSAPGLGNDSRIRVHIADARRFVRSAGKPYDVIIADLYHPSVDGSGALYAREHFAAIRERLAPAGVFCQWLPLHQLDIGTLKVIVRTFLDVFPQSDAYLAQFSVETPLVALVGRVGGPDGAQIPYPAGWLARRAGDPALSARLSALDLKDDLSLFGLYLAGAEQLSAFAGPGRLNTDDHPLVTAEAPRVAYASSDTPADRLVALLSRLSPRASQVVSDGNTQQRLAAYWKARDAYLAIGASTLAARSAGAAAAPQALIADIAPKLVALVRLSPDFEAAYAPVIAMARQLSVSDPAAARQLLEMLDRANPSRPEARRLLAVLPPGSPPAGPRRSPTR